ncbi:MAG: DUF4845 domain-containing protein [Herminiimonas sp.]|nr:DUF4845 domain-containing protein [Herminiimonas sp.]
MRLASTRHERGITLFGLIFVLALLGAIGVIAMKIVPTVIEYSAIKKAILAARDGATTPREVQSAFDKRAEVGYIDAIGGKDLVIVKNGSTFDVSFAYDKKIPLFGPASILLEYEGTTANTGPTKKAIE